MAKTIRNEFDKALNYENLMKAHLQSKKGKGYRKEIILFNLKQEEYIMWLYNQLKNLKYKHGGYAVFYITEPKVRRIEKSKYIDRIVHRWYVNSFIKPYFVPQFIETSYACLENKGMHKACLDVQKAMKHCKNIWGEYYILKMDIKKYFENIKIFLSEKLKLELNKKTQIFKNKQGVNFCGYKINEYRLKIRDKGKRKLKKKIKSLKEMIKIGEINSKEAKSYLAGHLGYIKIANVKNLKEKLFF